jgi:hypothetical protein
VRIPYGKDVLKKCYQKIVVEEELLQLKARIKKEGVNYFENQW